MNAVRPCTPSLVEYALGLIAGAEIERPEKAKRLRTELEQWRAASATNESAYAEALRQWNALSNVAPALRARFVEPAQATKLGKHNVRATLTVAAFVLGFAGLLGWHLQQPTFERALRTGTAQVAQLALPDGSRIDLNAKTGLQVTLYRDRRVVLLKHGEARFEVAADPARPFRVETREGTVEVVGTAFTVSDRGQRVTVNVERGRVRVAPVAEPRPVELVAGERVSVHHGIADPVQQSGEREFAPWRDGWLVFDNERLADALPAINAFRAAPITLADDRAGTLRLTGRFRADDTRGLLAALPRILPLNVTERAGGSAEISSR
jgi:transmembrane sensor